MSRWRLAYWLVAVATAAIYTVMVVWTLPTVQRLAGGLVPFDLRPAGYGVDQAAALVATLGPEGREYYLTVQQTLDTFYPGLMAVVLVFAFRSLSPGRAGALLSLVSVLAAGFDYLENWAVRDMLLSGVHAEGFARTARLASMATVAKSALATVALVTLLVLLVRHAVRKMRGKA